MILEESLVGSPLVQIVWQGLQYLDNSRNPVGGVWRRNWAAAVGDSKLGRYSEGDELEAYSKKGHFPFGQRLPGGELAGGADSEGDH